MMNETYQVAEVEVSYKPKFNVQERPKISKSASAFNIFKQQWDIGKIQLLEQSKVILLSNSNRVLGLAHIAQGGVTMTIIDPKVIFAIALKANASKIIIGHNHPSGNLNPSNSDLELTKRLCAVGKLLDIEVIDHLIIAANGYYSLADNGLI